ncbi:hypothetical protein GCM10020331_099450 [Ectobacillus funiculus]
MLGDKYFISISVVIAIVFVLAAMYVAKYTEFGRTVYAIGGNEQSAMLMGLPVVRTKNSYLCYQRFLVRHLEGWSLHSTCCLDMVFMHWV